MKKNDKIRVKNGVKDPDFSGCTIGGWTGIITSSWKDESGEKLYLIKWDEEVLKNMPDNQKSNGLSDDECALYEQDLEKIENKVPIKTINISQEEAELMISLLKNCRKDLNDDRTNKETEVFYEWNVLVSQLEKKIMQ